VTVDKPLGLLLCDQKQLLVSRVQILDTWKTETSLPSLSPQAVCELLRNICLSACPETEKWEIDTCYCVKS
jgi:hypothetical protein